MLFYLGFQNNLELQQGINCGQYQGNSQRMIIKLDDGYMEVLYILLLYMFYAKEIVKIILIVYN